MASLQRDGVRISYQQAGPRDQHLPLLLTHGFGESAQMWSPNLPALAAERLVVTWDLRGHGRSDSPDDPAQYSQDACVDDMAAVLDECGVTRAVIGGLSLGGYLSLAFWLRFPERVAALLLCDTGPGYRSDEPRQRWNERALATAARLERAQDASLGHAHAARGILTQRDGRVIGSLSSIDVPVLVLVGQDDAPFLPAAEYIAAKIPGAVRHVIPDAGHVCNADQPEAFNELVLEFLRQVS